MKKIIPIFIIISFLLPSISFANEGLFYYFKNVYGLKNFSRNYKKIDIIAPQVYEVGYDLKVSKPVDKNIIKEAKRKGAKIVPLIVNDDFSKILMSNILINPKAQDEIIDFMIKEAKKNDFLGWQFDFENINHLDRDMYSEFVKKTYKKMKENNLQFSVAVIVRADDYDPQSQNQDWSSAYDYKKLAENSDFLSLMSYDDPKSIGPVASLPYINRILDYKLKNISPEKLSLGIPLYCWQWQDGKRTNSTTYNLAEKAYKKVKDKNKNRNFDKVLGAEVFEFKRDGVNHKIWCDNQESFAIKFDLIEEKGLRGFSAWALGQEDKRLWSLLN